MMCNETKHDEEEYKDYLIILYRLDHLENAQKENFKELMKTLQIMQQGQNEQNKTLIELTQRQQVVEQKIQCIDRLKEVATKHGEEIRTISKRLEIYKQILMALGTGVGAALLIEIIKFI
ncbi:hypothetical protein [Methanosphaera sp.]|uniref:hypothetical protein n=1 Tax=Methanosphaera sp. TaxID=2666342 RepID=UPI0025CD6505|nr:hypothetical protein [Methanosphaera sp.]